MIETVVTSSILIVVLIVMRAIFASGINRRLQYALWGLVLLRLCLPFGLLGSPMSVMNVMNDAKADLAPSPSVYATPAPAQTASVVTDVTATSPLTEISETGAADEDAAKSDTPSYQSGTEAISQPDLKSTATTIWWIGSLALGVWLLGTNIHFKWSLKKERQPFDVDNCPLPVYIAPRIASPCLTGVFRPAIYLTPKAAENKAALPHVIAHECAHFRQGDHIWTVLRGLCLAAYWWNPLVWIAAILSSVDSEMACDEAVIHQLGDDNRLIYGRTLVDMIAVKAVSNGLFMAASTMMSGKRQLRQRLKRIAHKPNTTASAVAAVLLSAAILAGCTFTGAQSAKKPEDSGVDDAKPSSSGVSELAQKLYEARNPYIGNAPADGNIMRILGIADKLNNYTVELKTSSEPYVLKLIFTGSTSNATAFDGAMSTYAFFLLALIDNASEIQWQYQYTPGITVRAGSGLNTEMRAGSLTVKRAAEILKVSDIKDFGKSAESVQKLISQLPQIGVTYTITTLSKGKALSETVALDSHTAFYAEGMLMQVVLSSTINPAVDLTALETSYLLQSTTSDGTVHDYYLFMKDGAVCVQEGVNGFYVRVKDYELYKMITLAAANTPDGVNKNLEASVSKAILSYNGRIDGSFGCESHVTLGVTEEGKTVTVYAMVLYQTFRYTEDGPTEVSGSHMPVAITFDKNANGEYELREYWEPKDGSEYIPSIKEKFPAEIAAQAVDTQKYIMGQEKSCYDQMVRNGGIDTNPIIGKLFDELMASPAASSNPEDYIKEHPIAYRELQYYGKYTLNYISGEFSKGGQTGLRGQLMLRVLKDLLDGQVPEYQAATPQDWYDQWKAETTGS